MRLPEVCRLHLGYIPRSGCREEHGLSPHIPQRRRLEIRHGDVRILTKPLDGGCETEEVSRPGLQAGGHCNHHQVR